MGQVLPSAVLEGLEAAAAGRRRKGGASDGGGGGGEGGGAAMMTSMASQAPAGAVPDMEVYVEVMHAHVEAMADLVRRECEDVKALVCM